MFEKRLNSLCDVLQQCVYTDMVGSISSDEALLRMHQMLQRVKEAKGKVYVIGNGGSAGIASHFCVDLVNALKIPALTLYDSNVMSCISNDFGYEHVFSNPLELMLGENDLLVAISSSGKSKNILNAVEVAQAKESSIVTLSGFLSENPLRQMGDLNFWLDKQDYGLVETGHFFLLHTVIDAWQLNYVEKIKKLVSLSNAK